MSGSTSGSTTGSMTRAELQRLIPGLTEARLAELIAAGIVRPVHSNSGDRFREIDAARLQLALDLEEAFELHDEALELVLSLIDQLNGARGDMRAMLGALAEEPPETRARLRGLIRELRVVTVRR
ncbi:hypothetical protein [Paracoccus sphaerophysae]|uniref:hypothetical protein n=1 Tax=Paracoccus sphaerophysae TaxID=690417 RepID=UPI0023548A3D|nr:hypothetical protein [Paracoccus sphaerophysae]